MGAVVLCDPGNGQRGRLRGAVSGVFHRPVDIDGAVGILVVNALGRCQLGCGRWCLHDDPGIENSEGIENIDKIVSAADGIMVARGDMGVEIPAYEVPQVQKMIVEKCNVIVNASDDVLKPGVEVMKQYPLSQLKSPLIIRQTSVIQYLQ